MVSMVAIPFISSITLFGFYFSFGLLVAVLYIYFVRFPVLRIDPIHFLPAAAVLSVTSLAGSHIAWVLFDANEAQRSELSVWFNLQAGMKSIGGIVFTFLALELIVFVKKAPREILYGLALEAGFIWLAFTRIGCSLLQEHLGEPTSYWFGAVDSFGVRRHNLGLYEAVFLFLVVVPSLLHNRKRQSFLYLLPVVAVSALFRLSLAGLEAHSLGGGAFYLAVFLAVIFVLCKLNRTFIRNEGV